MRVSPQQVFAAARMAGLVLLATVLLVAVIGSGLTVTLFTREQQLDRIAGDAARVMASGPDMSDAAIAARYEALGGRVRYHGKPHAEIYRPVLEMLGLPKERCLAVGDSMATDIQGATNAGIAALLVADGIHREVLDPAETGAIEPERLAGLAGEFGLAPVAAVQRFVW